MFPAYLTPPERDRRDGRDGRPGASAAGRRLGRVARELRPGQVDDLALDLRAGSDARSVSGAEEIPASALVVVTVNDLMAPGVVWPLPEEGCRAPAAVLALPPPDRAELPDPDRLFQHVLIPLDGSVTAETAVPHAVELGRLADARYTLLHVLPSGRVGGCSLPDDGPGPPWSAREADEARASLRRVAALMTLQGLLVTEMVVRGEHPARAIVEVARDVGADMIALTTPGGRLGGRLLGDVAERVLFGTTVPVLLCRPPQV